MILSIYFKSKDRCSYLSSGSTVVIEQDESPQTDAAVYQSSMVNKYLEFMPQKPLHR